MSRYQCVGRNGCNQSGRCVPSNSKCAPYKSLCDCKIGGCGRQRWTCRCGGPAGSQPVPDPAGEFYSYEDALRNGCGSQCTPSNFLGSYVGAQVYYPDCSGGSCSNTNESCCNVLKVNPTGRSNCSGGGGSNYMQAGLNNGGYSMGISTGLNQYGGSNLIGEPIGPCVRGLDSNVLMAADNQVGCAGFEGILIDRPRDLLWENDLFDDPTVLTTTRYQSWDLRGDIAVGAVNGCCELGCMQKGAKKCGKSPVGPFCGTYLPSFGPFQNANPCNGAGVRTFIY